MLEQMEKQRLSLRVPAKNLQVPTTPSLLSRVKTATNIRFSTQRRNIIASEMYRRQTLAVQAQGDLTRRKVMAVQMMRMLSSEFVRDNFNSSIKIVKGPKSANKTATSEQRSLESAPDNLLFAADIQDSDLLNSSSESSIN